MHFTVTLAELKNVHRYIEIINLYRGSLYRGSTVPIYRLLKPSYIFYCLSFYKC